jgi:hypothetical protein
MYASDAGTATTAGNVTGVVTVANGGTGSNTQSFVDLTTNQNIGGDKTFSNRLAANIVSAQVSYNIGPVRILGIGADNTGVFVGQGTGNVSSGGLNTFVGTGAGRITSGTSNSFIGYNAGFANQTGTENAFVGSMAGHNNTGSSNSFFGHLSGFSNVGGFQNSFFGHGSGAGNVSGNSNTLIGYQANVGPDNLTNATAIGAGAAVWQSNSLVLGNDANVGIGTHTPQTRLDVVGTPSKLIRTEGSSTSGTWINLTNTAGGRSWNIISSGTGNGEGAGKLMFFDETAFATRMTIDANGHVVINALGTPGATSLCRNAANQISTCTPGNLPQQSGGENSATLNSLREQLKEQQLVIEQLKAIVCTSSPAAAVCKGTSK